MAKDISLRVSSLKISMKYFYRLITVLVMLNILMNHNSWLPESAAQSPEVSFPDANLAAAVRAQLALGATDPITQADLDRLIVLDASNAGIRDLTGLEEAINLEQVNLSDNQISDITPLSNLTKITRLSLWNNQISDITPLSNLTKIWLLYLWDNQISDITPLSNLTKIIALGLANNQISDITPLSNLTKMDWLDLSDNQISDITPLSNLTKIRYLSLSNNQISDFTVLAVLTNIIELDISNNEPRTNISPRCGLGWAPQSPYTHPLEQPKVMIYALEFEFKEGRYTCSAIEIRTGDATLTHLEGWQLYLGTLYNPSYIPIVLTQANSQITNNLLRLTPEMLGLETFPCNTVGGISHPLPGVQYVLKSDENVMVDTAFSCSIWGQNAWTTVDGVNVESPRRISSAALREMETPRLERYITDPTGIFITYMDIEEFGWDRAVLSDWLLPPSEPSAPGAPSAIQRKLGTTWGALKKQ